MGCKPKHPAAAHLQQIDFFKSVKTFKELESKIQGIQPWGRLTKNQAMGDAFEVFAEAHLSTIHGAKVVYPDKNMPAPLRAKLKLPLQDKGVDGVYETLDGEFHAYQVKFRSGRTALNWGDDKLGNFAGLSDRCDYRLLFANSDDISKELETRDKMGTLRGTDLDELTEDQLSAIASWIDGAYQPIVPKTPRADQREAIRRLKEALKTNDRATAVMACGTGKSLVSLWLTQEMKTKTALVLLPSLALVNQLLTDWHTEQEDPTKFVFKCVCSDDQVASSIDDRMAVTKSDFSHPVTSDPKVIRKFMGSEFNGLKVIFSTYQSSPLVGEAMKHLPAFDLGIFDEAHKTAGAKASNFNHALRNDNIRINKRVFFTATPRLYNPAGRTKDDDPKLLFSMDNKSVYGPIAYELSFRQAVELDVICDFKVAVSVVSSSEVRQHIESNGGVYVEGDLVRIPQVARQLALKKAVEKYGVSKIFTFHNRIASAASFASEGSEGIGTHLPTFDYATHIQGKMRTTERKSILGAFRDSDTAILSNARCLTEGVNLPAVDMIAFMAKKKSRIDIVQASGRAMRKHGTKERGYIFLPLFIDRQENETEEEAAERLDYGEIINVLNALKETDEALRDVINELRYQRGLTRQIKGVREGGLSDFVEVLGSTDINLDVLEASITTEIVDRLSAHWEEMFGLLVAYKDEHGHCNVPQTTVYRGENLGTWVNDQRTRKNLLSEDRIRRLEDIGFVWDLLEAQWEEMFGLLVAYKDKHGDCNVPAKEEYRGENLGIWVNTQRQSKKKDNLSTERFQRLEGIGFVWDPFDAQWEEMFGLLIAYKDEHGHCDVPLSTVYRGENLGSWVQHRRADKKNGELSEDRIKRLDEIGFVWDVLEAAWEEMFGLLVAYKDEHGDCNMPQTTVYRGESLGIWVGTQRKAKRKGNLSAKHIRRLENIGFVWDVSEAYWEEMFGLLVAYKDEHGDCNVPAREEYREKNLGAWVHSQRTAKRIGRLSADRIKRLEAIGFKWSA